MACQKATIYIVGNRGNNQRLFCSFQQTNDLLGLFCKKI